MKKKVLLPVTIKTDGEFCNVRCQFFSFNVFSYAEHSCHIQPHKFASDLKKQNGKSLRTRFCKSLKEA